MNPYIIQIPQTTALYTGCFCCCCYGILYCSVVILLLLFSIFKSYKLQHYTFLTRSNMNYFNIHILQATALYWVFLLLLLFYIALCCKFWSCFVDIVVVDVLVLVILTGSNMNPYIIKISQTTALYRVFCCCFIYNCAASVEVVLLILLLLLMS